MGGRGDKRDSCKTLPIRGLVRLQEVASNAKISSWVSLAVPVEILKHDAVFK